MDDADVCIVIGFSFRDEHINNIFINYLNLQKPFIVISPTINVDIKNNLLKNSNDILDNENIKQIDKSLNGDEITDLINKIKLCL